MPFPSIAPLHLIVLIGAPVTLGLLGLSEPLLYPNVPLHRQIAPIADWWYLLHLLYLPLLGLLALGVLFLTQPLSGTAARVSRAAIGVFAVFHIATNAIIGVAAGLLARHGNTLPQEQQAVVAQAVQRIWDSLMVGNFSLVTVLGHLGWVVAVIAAAVSLRRAGAARGAIACLVTGGLIFGFTSARPFGPIGMALYAAGIAWLLYAPQRAEVRV